MDSGKRETVFVRNPGKCALISLLNQNCGLTGHSNWEKDYDFFDYVRVAVWRTDDTTKTTEPEEGSTSEVEKHEEEGTRRRSTRRALCRCTHVDADDLYSPLSGDAVELVQQHRRERLLLGFE